MLKRIAAIDKATGQVFPIGREASLMTPTVDVPWTSVRAEQLRWQKLSFGPLILSQPIVATKLSEEPVEFQWDQGGEHHKIIGEKGVVGLYPAGEIGAISAASPGEFLLVALEANLFIDIANQAGLPGDIRLPQIVSFRDDFILQTLLQFRQEMLSGYPGGRILGESLAAALSAYLLFHYGTSDSNGKNRSGLPDAVLQKVLAYIDANLNSEIGLPELAGEAFMSPFHFARLFRQSTGFSPYQYLIKRRVDHAIRLIQGGEQDLNSIAHAVGFYDSSHLRRHFKKVVGVGPKEFLRITR